MRIRPLRIVPLIALLIVMIGGCEENENTRLAELAERQLERQAEQNRQLQQMQHEVAEGSRRLVEADARSREEVI